MISRLPWKQTEYGFTDADGCAIWKQEDFAFLVKAVNFHEEFHKTLIALAAYSDTSANLELEKTGTYVYFDEPHAVQKARELLIRLQLPA